MSGLVRLWGADAQAGAPATVRRAIEFIEARAGHDVTVAEIAVEARLGVRGLQTAFRIHCDATPLEYLRSVRMARAHADLQGSDATNGDTVNAVAARWRFTNPGRFSASYRQAYGCYPAATLRADPPTARVMLPNFDAALVALGIDPDDPADADDRDAVAAVWHRRTLGPPLGPPPAVPF